MLWHFWVGRFLQTVAGIGALLTLADWIRLGSTHVRVGQIVAWSIVGGAVAASVATWNARGRGCPRPSGERRARDTGSPR